MSNHLYFLHIAYGVEIYAFVLMSNHFHLVIRAPLNNLSQAMRHFMQETSRAITKSADRINQTWGQRHGRTILMTEHYFLLSYKYVYRNPVAAGIVERPEDYRFSTLHGLLGRSRLLIPLVEDGILFSDVERILDWLNVQSSAEDWKAVRTALRRNTFSLAKDPDTKRPHRLETELI